MHEEQPLAAEGVAGHFAEGHVIVGCVLPYATGAVAVVLIQSAARVCLALGVTPLICAALVRGVAGARLSVT